MLPTPDSAVLIALPTQGEEVNTDRAPTMYQHTHHPARSGHFIACKATLVRQLLQIQTARND